MTATSKSAIGRHHLASMLVFVALLMGILVSFAGSPTSAQPLCLGDTIWDKEKGECVPLPETQPTEETVPAEPPLPTETVTPTPSPTEAVNVETPEQVEPVATSPDNAVPVDTDALDAGEPLVTLRMIARWCPDTIDPISLPYDARNQQCPVLDTTLVSVQFSLSVDGKAVTGWPGSTANGSGAWGTLPAGVPLFGQTAPPGFSGPVSVMCSRISGPADAGTFVALDTGGAFAFPKLLPGSSWLCDSYMLLRSTGEITAFVWDCPASLDIYTSEPETLKATCAPYLQNIQFELGLADVHSNSNTNTLGRTTYRNVRPGTYRLRQNMRDGYGVPVVFCTVLGPNGQTLANYDRFNVSNAASIELHVNEAEFVTCDFFQAPAALAVQAGQPVEIQGTPDGQPTVDPIEPETGIDDGPGIPQLVEPADAAPVNDAPNVAPGMSFINMDSRACPDGFDAHGADLPTLYATCQTAQAGVGFTLMVNNSTIGSATTNPSGFATIQGAPAGTFELVSANVPGYSAPVSVCKTVDRITGAIVVEAQRHYPSATGLLTIPGVVADQGVYCTWFTTPTDATGSINVVAWACPEGYDISIKGPEELIGDCGQKLDGVEFQLVHPRNGISTQYTSRLRSTAYFRNISPGQLTLRESTPDGFGAPIVFCEARGPQGQTIDQYDRYNVSTNASVQLGMDGFDHFTCDFFHVPVSQQASATSDVAWTTLAPDVNASMHGTTAGDQHSSLSSRASATANSTPDHGMMSTW